MPIQASQWADYLCCPVCGREFAQASRSPISLSCGHTLCRQCITQVKCNLCPIDLTVIQSEESELVVNTALLQLSGVSPPSQPYRPPSVRALPVEEQNAYDVVIQCMEEFAAYVRNSVNNNNDTGWSGRPMSRPIQRKLVALVQCAVTSPEGRGRAARAARSLAERTVTEMLLQYQNAQQLTVNLWAAVRARGCQFLGPAMQEEVLKLVLLALEDGTALSRKVLVMFVVQKLEPDFPQASKTSIGHVVQLLYRASCFKVSKRESDSSLMQLKEEFRSYESLRREHDAQIVQIAIESGLRIAPDQWSALLYGDTGHKPHMQSIIDKLQTPQLLVQSIKELVYTLHRTGEHTRLLRLHHHLERLVSIDAKPDAKSPSLQTLAENLTSLKEVVSGLLHYPAPTVSQDANEQAENGTDDVLDRQVDNFQYEHVAPTASDMPDFHRLPMAMTVPPPAPFNPLVPPPPMPYVVLNDQRYATPPPNIGVPVLIRQMVPQQIAPNQRHLHPLPQPQIHAPAQAPMQAFYPYPIPNMPSVPAFMPVMPGVQYNWRGTNFQQGHQLRLRLCNSREQSRMPFARRLTDLGAVGSPGDDNHGVIPPLDFLMPPPVCEWADQSQQIAVAEDEVPSVPMDPFRPVRAPQPNSVMEDVDLEPKIEEVKRLLAGVISSPER